MNKNRNSLWQYSRVVIKTTNNTYILFTTDTASIMNKIVTG